MTKYSQDPVWTPQFIHLFAIEGFLQMGIFASRPLVANYALFLGAAVATAATIAGLNMIVALLMRPVGGIVSDRFNKKSSLVICSAAFFISALGCAFAPTVEIVAVFVAVQGIAYCFKSISITSLARLVSSENRVGSAIGWIGLLSALAAAVGPLTGTFIRDLTGGYHYSFLYTALLTGFATILSILFKNPEKTAPRKTSTERIEGGSLKRVANEMFYAPAVPLALIGITVMMGHGTLTALVITLQDINFIENGAVYFIAYSIAALASRPLAGRLFDARGLARVALPSMALTALGLLTVVIFQNTIAVAVCGVLLGLGQSSAHCSLQSEVVRKAPSAMLGRATNTYYFGPDIGMGLGPAISGAILQAFGGQALFIFNVIVISAGFIALAMMTMRNPEYRKRRAA